MTKPKDATERLIALMGALAEHVASASDQELLDQAAAEGIDVKANTAHVRDVLLSAVLRTKKERLRKAREAHERAVTNLGVRVARLPGEPEARRCLLMRCLQRRTQMHEAVMTLQHRDFESFSDADVESALRQLEALGLLDDESESKP